MATRKLEVQIVGDSRSFEKALGKMEGSVTSFGGTAKKAGIAAAAGFAALGAGAVVGAKKAIDAASNLDESVNAVNVVFGKASKQITDFSEKAATEAGLSMRAFNERVTPVGASLQNVGFSADQAAKSSIALTKRAADMASVFNVDVTEALGAIQAGLRGEADPLERFGVGLSDAAVKAKAMSLGLAETEKELTANDKAQARLALLMQQTNKVAGDFTNTSDSMANRQRILRAEFENLQAKIGEKLLPVVTKALGAFLDVTNWVEKTAVPKFRELADKLFGGGGKGDSVRGAFEGVSGFVKETFLPMLRNLWDFIDKNIVPVFQSAKDIMVDTMTAIGKVLKDNEPELKRLLGFIGDIGKAMLFLVREVIHPVLRPVLTKVLPEALNITIQVLDTMVTAIQKIIDGFEWIGKHAGGIAEKVGKAWGFVSDTFGKLPGRGDVAAGFNSAAADAMRPVIGGGGLAPQTASLLGQIQAMFGNVLMTSGLRSPEQNAAVQGAPNSDHLTGRAIDLVPASGWNASTVALFDKIAAWAAGNPAIRWIGWRGVPGHGPYDHLHLSTFDRGGVVPGFGPQLIQAHGGETILPTHRGPVVVQVMLDRQVLAEALFDPLRNKAQQFAQGAGRSAFA